ncbi:hypothetical protein AAMO2058_001288200 [Amorphochlora amoebiformis]|mmetsp:Transcript_30603/g.49070  ORF Transcript_30603/g.49070 Transcript_30603/m.49070 type:complete len:433 (-) Transcript_30603:139-1437(-)
MNEEELKKVPLANVTAIPLASPSAPGAFSINATGQNILLLQNYLTSQYMLNQRILQNVKNLPHTASVVKAVKKPIPNKAVEPRTVTAETRTIPAKIKFDLGKKKLSIINVARAKDDESGTKKQKKRAQKRKKRLAKEGKKQSVPPPRSRQPKRPKHLPKKDTSEEADKLKPTAITTPRQKPTSNDLLGFVSLSLPVPRDISAEWENYKKEIITPPWQQQEINVEEVEDSSSEEEVSDEVYFEWHKRSYERDCKRIQDVLKTAPQKSAGSKCWSTRKQKKKEESRKKSLSQPVAYNYDVQFRPWRKPCEYVMHIGNSEKPKPFTKPASKPDLEKKAEAEIIAKTGPVKPPRKRRRKRSVSANDILSKSKVCSEELASMRLKYLELCAELNRLRGEEKDSGLDGSLKWKAENKVGKNGKKTNVIRLRRVTKLAA